MEEKTRQSLRCLPSVDEMLQAPEVKPFLEQYTRSLVVNTVRRVIDGVRHGILAAGVEGGETSPAKIIADIRHQLEQAVQPSLQPVINATGVILHTNLGRAVLAPQAIAAVTAVAGGYSNLEFDRETGERGSRYTHVERLLCELTGAQAALVVNNNAAAVLLVLSALAKGREVIISRGQLVEIGGAFRVPDVMAQSGAVLVEVGTTNKTYIQDYARAITAHTALLLKVHTSNYRIVGFTAEVTTADLVALGRAHHLPVFEDLGSGMLVDLSSHGFDEPTAQDSLAAGVDVVTVSGDKLLGGPQAGIILGTRQVVSQLKTHPLLRAIRIDKLSLAALEATLRIYLAGEPLREIPVLAMLTADSGRLAGRAAQLARELTAVGDEIKISLVPGFSQVGGGALPLAELPTTLVSVQPVTMSAQRLAEGLRKAQPPVIARIVKDSVLFDVRTIPDEAFAIVARVMRAVLNAPARR